MNLMQQNCVQEILIPPGVINTKKTIIIEIPKVCASTSIDSDTDTKTIRSKQSIKYSNPDIQIDNTIDQSITNILLEFLQNKEILERKQLHEDLMLFQEARRHYLLKSTKEANKFLNQLKNQVEKLENGLSKKEKVSKNEDYQTKVEFNPHPVYVIKRLPFDQTLFIYSNSDYMKNRDLHEREL